MKRVIIIVLILAVPVVGFFVRSRLATGSPADKTQFKITRAETGTVKKTVSATGTLQPWKVIDIKSKAGGRVDVMGVDVGTIVKHGDLIAKIDPTDTKLQVDQAEADIESAQAREQGSSLTYDLQIKQSRLAVAQAQSALESARANLRAAQARRNTAEEQMKAQPELTKTSIESSKANYDNAVKQLSQMTEATFPQDRANAQSAVDQAVANEKNAKSNLARQKTLMEKGFVSQQVVDQAQASADVASAQVTAARRKLDTIDTEQRSEQAAMEARVAQAKAQYLNAKASGIDVDIRKSAYEESIASVEQLKHQVVNSQKALDLARANLDNIAIRKTDIASAAASKKRAQASLTNASATLDQTRVTAPTDGVILTKYVDQGTIISSALSFAASGNAIVQLGDISKMYVDVTVDETDIANVDEGQKVDVTMEAYPASIYQGKVIRIDPQAVVIQNVTMVHVRVEIDNSDPAFRLLKPGMNATCEFVISKKEDVVTVPNEAVRTDDKGRYVEIAKGGVPYKPTDGSEIDKNDLVDVTVIKRPVEVGLEGNDVSEIKDGLKEGDVVITQKIEPAPKTTGSPFGGQQRMGGIRTQAQQQQRR